MNKTIATLALFLAWTLLAFGAVNVNTATKDELVTLNGIGEVKAQAIIDYRTANGPFKSLADLDKVPGIGEATVKSIEPDVTFSGRSTVAAPEASTKKSGAGGAKASAPAKSDTNAATPGTAVKKSEGKSDAAADASTQAKKKAETKADAKAGAVTKDANKSAKEAKAAKDAKDEEEKKKAVKK